MTHHPCCQARERPGAPHGAWCLPKEGDSLGPVASGSRVLAAGLLRPSIVTSV